MFDLNEKTFEIQISKGDSGAAAIKMSGDVPNQATDKVWMSVKKSPYDLRPVIEPKQVPFAGGLYILEFTPEDTMNLPSGDYVWDLKVDYQNEDGSVYVHHPFEPKLFRVHPIVTRR